MPTQFLQPILRFAPSPTGELHLGHALSALINQLLADKLGGRLLLRVEDIDINRRRQDFVDGIYRDLKWLGITWEEPVLLQSERFDIYAGYLDRLRDADLLYPCFATRKEISEAAQTSGSGTDPDGAPIYPQLHKGMSEREVSQRLSSGEHFALRLDMEKAMWMALDCLDEGELSYTAFDTCGREERYTVDPMRWGDVVLARKDNGTSYHMACVIDDALQGVTHVVRGQDLQPATDIHRLLQILFDLSEPRYHHHALILDQDGRKLSKSLADTSLRQLRNTGASLADIMGELASITQQYDAFAPSR
ncbi:MAG: tRNA glutamyl-Q(34) synthetase GluQRS [Pseudomonadota bacterium]